MRNKLALVSIISLLFLLVLAPPLWAQTVTFVQLTDPHLYDAGAHLLQQAAREEVLDNRDALDWAILQINRLQTSGKNVDFVAITGDFGLDAPSPGVTSSSVEELARSLGALQVTMILVVPGNNDLVNEKPSDIGRFRGFIADLQTRLPDHVLVDLTQRTVVVNNIRLLGLDSASFKNNDGKDKIINRPDQLKEMRRLSAEIKEGHPHIIFTHIPDIEDPYRGLKGTEIHHAWQVDKTVSDSWNHIISTKEIIGVFAGHFHDPRRSVYAQDYSWTSTKPDLLTATKTWVAPPLAAKFQENANPQARGFLLVTASATGKVSAVPFWYGISPQPTLPADKAESILDGDESIKDGDWQKAADAYGRALTSSDPSTRTAAKTGYEKAREHMRSFPWDQILIRRLTQYLRHNWIELIVKLLLAILLLTGIAAFIRSLSRSLKQPYDGNKPPILLAPAKYTPDAPSELFAAEMVAATEELRESFSAVSADPYIRSAQINSTLFHPSQSFQHVIDSIPDIKGVNLGRVATFFINVFQYFSWHVESGIAIHADQAVGIAFLRRAWKTQMVLRASGTITSPIDVLRISRELAYNILGLPFVSKL
jgi:hypothetical protein